jgi:hypothetical protein
MSVFSFFSCACGEGAHTNTAPLNLFTFHTFLSFSPKIKSSEKNIPFFDILTLRRAVKHRQKKGSDLFLYYYYY